MFKINQIYMAETLEAPETGVNRLTNVEDRSLAGLGKMLAYGLPSTEEQEPASQTATPTGQAETVINELTNKGGEEITPDIEAVPVATTAITEPAPATATTPATTQITGDVVIEPNHWDDPTTLTIENKTENKESINKELELKAKEYDAIINDKFYAAYKSAKESGKDVNTFIKEINGTDPNKLTLSELMLEQLKSENLSQEAITAEMEEFEGLSERAKIRETKEIKDKLNKAQEARFSEYSANNQVNQAKMAEIGKRALQEKEQYLTSQTGKKLMGLEMTPTLTQELNDFYENFNITREDGSIDVPRIMQLGLLEKKSKVMLQNAYSKGKTDAELEFYKKHARPSKDNGTAVIPDVKNTNQKSQDAANVDALEKLYAHRGQGKRVS